MSNIFVTLLIPIMGIGVLVLFIIAVTQQGKQEGSGGFKQAFFTVVSLVMLGISVGALIALLTTVSRQTVFNTHYYEQQRGGPPQLYVTGTPNSVAKSGAIEYTCTSACEFTAEDKIQFASWKDQYQHWLTTPTSQVRFRSDMVGPLSFLIVALPLYFVFRRLMEHGAKQEQVARKKPSSLRSLYYYFVAFAGLVMVVVSAGSLINTGLKVWLKADTNTESFAARPVGIDGYNNSAGVKSVINCASACGFSDADVQLAQRWVNDDAQFQENLKQSTSQNDFATNLPALLVGIPLFWYHFARIRKEAQDTSPLPPNQPKLA